MKFIVLTFLFVFVNSDDSRSINPIGCGQRTNSSPAKIVGGLPAKVGDWGWMVGLNWLNQHDSHFCGGVLINSQWILSAAHCFYGLTNPNYYSANIGYYFRNSPLEWSINRKLSKIIMHENYNEITYANDIALLKVDSLVNYSEYITPACLANNVMIDYSGQIAWSTGWGNTLNSVNSNELLEVALPVLSETKCINMFPNLDTSTGFCVGYEGLGKDTCEGDSGGPLVINSNNGANRGNWTVAGIVSYGLNCGDGTVVTRVSNYYDWIVRNIANN